MSTATQQGPLVGLRIELRGTLRCTSAVHVGGWGESDRADLAVQRDGQGRLVLPGTSLAGVLRAWLTRSSATTAQEITWLFGYAAAYSQDGSPSLIRVDDAPATSAWATTVRTGVGIDRRTATAADDLLYDREVIPPGATFAFRLVAEHRPTNPEKVADETARLETAVASLTAALTGGLISVGAGSSRGLGAVTLTDATYRRVDLATTRDLVAYLTETAPWRPAGELLTELTPPADGRLTVRITWTPDDTVMVKDPLDGAVVDTLPLTEPTAEDSARTLLLPGSSIKGVLRAHAERIVRTVRRVDAPDRALAAVNDTRLGPVLDLFGAAGDASQGRPGRRGTLTCRDCRGTSRIDPTAWHQVTTATVDDPDSPDGRYSARQSLLAATTAWPAGARPRLSDHVAIDRWTGGAAESLLFSVLEPANATWEPIELVIDTGRLADHDNGHALVLLLLILRDLRDGWLRLGYGGTRGRGALTVESMTFHGTAAAHPWDALDELSLDEVLTDPPPAIRDALTRWRHAAAPVQSDPATASQETQP